MEAAAGLPSPVFIRAMREKLESFSDEQLSDAMREMESPDGEMEEKIVAYFAELGVLDGIKQAAEQEIFLREYKKGGNAND